MSAEGGTRSEGRIPGVSRHRLLAPHRLLLVALLAALGVVLYLAAYGPIWWQRFYHPLEHEPAIAAAAERNGLDPYLVAAVINAESGFREDEISSAGAVGLMQLLPTTAAEVREGSVVTGVVDAARLTDPVVNIELGVRHLARLVRRYDSVPAALTAYNAGPANADKWVEEARGGPVSATVDFPETRRYVERVMRERDRYAELYPKAFGEGDR